MQLTKVTAGEKQLFSKLKGATVRAVNGNSNAGKGWRPVCKGIYLGSECFKSELSAIKAGEKFIQELDQRIKTGQISVRPKIEKLKRGAKKDGAATSE